MTPIEEPQSAARTAIETMTRELITAVETTYGPVWLQLVLDQVASRLEAHQREALNPTQRP